MEFSKAFGSFKALERMNRAGSKEGKHYEMLMTSYALQFHGLVNAGWETTKKNMSDYDIKTFGEAIISKHGTLWHRFNKLCLASVDGGVIFNPDDYNYKPYKFEPQDFGLCNHVFGNFLFFSGITAIEGRFVEDDDSKQFNYGG